MSPSPLISKDNNKPLSKSSCQSRILRSSRGYTLVELLIVSSIFVVVMGAIYSSFISGMMLWKRTGSLSQIEGRAILRLERLSSWLRQSINFLPIGFNGSDNKLSFPYLDNVDILRMTLEFDSADRSLKISKDTYPDILEGKSNASQVFMHSVDEVSFSYYYFDNEQQSYLWRQEWEAEDGIPFAIKITLKIKDEIKSTTVFIPIA